MYDPNEDEPEGEAEEDEQQGFLILPPSGEFALWDTHSQYEELFWALWPYVRLDGTTGKFYLPDAMLAKGLDSLKDGESSWLERSRNFGLIWDQVYSALSQIQR